MTGVKSSPVVSGADWWRQALVYQIYPRSFRDANGDGIGDLKGITEKIPYLKELGVDAVWLSPFYPSALADGGYDVADYRDVDPKIGTLADFDEMSAGFKEAGIKVIVDIVPNHTSNDHVWFQAALKTPKGSAERNRYIFMDGKGENKDQPPTDWECMFGGSAWEPVGDGQYYLHLFDVTQPDLNWDNREIQDDFLKTLKFWADRGVSGFRIDVAHGCAKDLTGDLPNEAELQKITERVIRGGLKPNEHPYLDRDAVLEFYKEWRQLFNQYDPPLTAVAEAWVSPQRTPLYASKDGLGQSFSFDMLMSDYKPEAFRKVINDGLDGAKASGSSTTWVFSNHDVIRHATRHGFVDNGGYLETGRKYLLGKGKNPVVDVELGLRRAQAATLMILALPGSTYIYQGEELGLPEDADVADEDRQDPTWFRKQGVDPGRDGCRICLPWEAESVNMGFGPGKRPHLPQPAVYKNYAVDLENKDPNSTLNFYRQALKTRRELQTSEQLEWIESSPDVIQFRRPNGWEVLFNLGDDVVALPAGKKVVVASGKLAGAGVPRDTAVWLVPELAN